MLRLRHAHIEPSRDARSLPRKWIRSPFLGQKQRGAAGAFGMTARGRCWADYCLDKRTRFE
ncbi:hypothetical protein A7982_13041 [Minicystis rosea]|nr:hypothetical protein A7982_13041 [Minicystis rosea]